MHRRRNTFAAAFVVALGFVAFAPPAHADKVTDAEELFRRAKALTASGKWGDACPLFEESEKMDPQMGTLLNLAICHENVGRIASAWGEFRAVEQMAKVANRADRVQLAQERALKLEPRLPRIKMNVPADAKVPGYTIRVDGEEKGEPLWDGVAVDPGTRTVEASAPGKKPQSMKVKIEDEAITVPITLPVLEDAPPEEQGISAEEQRQLAAYQSARSRRTTALVVGGAGLVTVAAGAVFGALALSSKNDARDQCPAPCFIGSTQATASDSATDRALVFANVSNVVLALGVIAVGVGTFLYFTAGPTKKPATHTAALQW